MLLVSLSICKSCFCNWRVIAHTKAHTQWVWYANYRIEKSVQKQLRTATYILCTVADACFALSNKAHWHIKSSRQGVYVTGECFLHRRLRLHCRFKLVNHTHLMQTFLLLQTSRHFQSQSFIFIQKAGFWFREEIRVGEDCYLDQSCSRMGV